MKKPRPKKKARLKIKQPIKLETFRISTYLPTDIYVALLKRTAMDEVGISAWVLYAIKKELSLENK